MFDILKTKVAERFAAMLAAGPVFNVTYDRDAIWQTYLTAFPEDSRQEHNCNACQAFIRQIGGAVSIGEDDRLITIWSVSDIPEEYVEAITALNAYVSCQPVTGLYYLASDKAGKDAPDVVGRDKNFSANHDCIFQHFHVGLPDRLRDIGGRKASENGAFTATKEVLKRALEEIPAEVTDTVLELIAQNSLHKGPEFKHLLDALRSMQAAYAERKAMHAVYDSPLLDNYCWRLASVTPEATARVRNTAIGTLLVDLAEGRELESAVRSYETKVGGASYQRTTALVTPRMIEDAKATLAELNLLEALDRRQLDGRDITVAHATFVYRPTTGSKDVFAKLAGEVKADPKTLAKVEEITIENFWREVVPKAKSLRVLVESHHLANFVALTGPVDPEARGLFKWGNSFGWSYTGGVADSVKQRVKMAGGQVDGWMRISLSWYNSDDLDLHFLTPQFRVYHGNKQDPRTRATLDVDMHVGGPYVKEPVENVHIPTRLPVGRYAIMVRNYTCRGSADSGWAVEVESGGRLWQFSAPRSPGSQQYTEPIEFDVAGDGEVTFRDNTLAKTATGVTKWGLKTGAWATVKLLTLSPNHWDRPIGSKEYFFMLEGCVADEKVRAFYNVFLTEELAKHRKVTEVLAGAVEVAKADGAELSGLGFSETIRNHVFVEVTGTFTRVVKVLI